MIAFGYVTFYDDSRQVDFTFSLFRSQKIDFAFSLKVRNWIDVSASFPKSRAVEGEEINVAFSFPKKPNQYIYWQFDSDVYWGGLPAGKETIVLGSFKGSILTDNNGEAFICRRW